MSQIFPDSKVRFFPHLGQLSWGTDHQTFADKVRNLDERVQNDGLTIAYEWNSKRDHRGFQRPWGKYHGRSIDPIRRRQFRESFPSSGSEPADTVAR